VNQRKKNLIKHAEKINCDTLVTFEPENLFYLTGFWGEAIGLLEKNGNTTIIAPVEEGREEEKKMLTEKFGGEVNMTDFSFVQVYDVISVTNGTWYLENQVLAWLDENGTPTMTRKIVYNDIRKKELDSQSAFYSHAVEKVFQWWNMDNDLLEVAELDVRPSWTKKLKKYNKTSKQKQKSIRYKTLVVRPTIKVVDSNGVERTPKLREIAQHTRRGHFAHYGINGKGKLFGKYTKSVYRKPKTIGKLSNGLVLKDYTLETERGEEE
jgi:hypothetical protein